MLNNSTIQALTASYLHDVHGTIHSQAVFTGTRQLDGSEKRSTSDQRHDFEGSYEKSDHSMEREAEIIETRMKLESMDRGCGGCR